MTTPTLTDDALREQLAAIQPLVDAVNRALDAYGRRGVTLKESTEREMAEFDRECPASAFPNVGARMVRLSTWTRERHTKIRGDLEDALSALGGTRDDA